MDAITEAPLKVLDTFSHRVSGNKAPTGKVFHVGIDGKDTKLAVVSYRQYKNGNTSDPRTVITAQAARSGVDVEMTYRPPLTFEQIGEKVLQFAKAALVSAEIIENPVQAEQS